ncbi:MAG: hypothetical protein IPG18_15950 [Saprospiraceae bacterium]|nr:hypothetical protein [Saprospiraceae bacterium]
MSRKEYINKIYLTKGYLGNYMAVYPNKNLVVVRMISNESFIKGKGTKDGTGYNNFTNFIELTKGLID